MTARLGDGALAVAAALLAATAAADLLGALAGVPALWRAASHAEIMGVCAGALGAALRVGALAGGPRGRRPSRRRLAWSLAALLPALVLFALAWWVRGDADIPPDPALLLVEPLAAGLLVAGAWSGRAPARPLSGPLAPSGAETRR